MITPQIFSQLLKIPGKQEIFFSSFLNKYQSLFDQTIEIKFASNNYKDVDVKTFFYNRFKDFVEEDLNTVSDNIPFDNWVYDLAEKRVQEIRSAVNREVARIATMKGGAQNWRKAYDIICREYRYVFVKVVAAFFKDDKYKGYLPDIISMLMTMFYMSRPNPNPIDKIDNFEGWLFISVRNCANAKRKKIEEELGLIEVNSNLDPNMKTENDESDGDSSVYEGGESSSALVDINQSNIDNVNEQLEEEFVKDDFVDEDPYLEHNWAIAELERYLQILEVDYPQYADLIRARKIEGVEVETLCEERDCTRAAIYNMTNEAMIQLVRIAVPVIRERNRKMYQIYSFVKPDEEKLVLDNDEKLLLKEVFENGKSLNELAVELKKLPPTINALFKSAYDKLKKIKESYSEERNTSQEELELKRIIGWNE